MKSQTSSIPTKKKLYLILPLFLFWISGTVYGFWYFQARDLQAFDPATSEQMARFDGNAVADSLMRITRAKHFSIDHDVNDINGISHTATVVHFWNPACPCNRFNDVHVKQIMEQYRAKDIRFLTVIHSRPGQNTQKLLAQAEETFGVPAILESRLRRFNATASPPASPAAAVLTSEGQLAYFGPYSEGAFCGANGGAFVENALDQVLQGENPQDINTLAFGCYCQWQPAKQFQASMQQTFQSL